MNLLRRLVLMLFLALVGPALVATPAGTDDCSDLHDCESRTTTKAHDDDDEGPSETTTTQAPATTTTQAPATTTTTAATTTSTTSHAKPSGDRTGPTTTETAPESAPTTAQASGSTPTSAPSAPTSRRGSTVRRSTPTSLARRVARPPTITEIPVLAAPPVPPAAPTEPSPAPTRVQAVGLAAGEPSERGRSLMPVLVLLGGSAAIVGLLSLGTALVRPKA